MTDDLFSRIAEKFAVLDNGCWQWTAALNGAGYGVVSSPLGRRAHRVVYQLTVGPIPDGLQLDHLCRNRACVNPDHLEPVTQQENSSRSPIMGAHLRRVNGGKTHCSRGHQYDEVNTRITRQGARACRACRRARYAEQRVSA